jgi:aminoglycoside 3-N-acetyltransferase
MQNKMGISRESITKDIRNLGIKAGDTLYIAADLLEVGFFVRNLKQTYKEWVDLLLEIVGPSGTIIVPAYTNIFLRFKRDKNNIFDRFSKPNSGSLALAILHDERSVRSMHPTNSYLGLGLNAHFILDNHDHTKLSYYPIGKIVELGGKILMMGTIDKTNAPAVFHYAQEFLGHTMHHPYNGLYQTYYKDTSGNIKLFTKHDNGGCSRGGYNLYGSLIVNDAVRFGLIGNGKSSVSDAKKSFEIISEILRRKPEIVLCDDKFCTSCYGRWSYNGINTIHFYINKYLLHKIATKTKLLFSKHALTKM